VRKVNPNSTKTGRNIIFKKSTQFENHGSTRVLGFCPHIIISLCENTHTIKIAEDSNK